MGSWSWSRWDDASSRQWSKVDCTFLKHEALLTTHRIRNKANLKAAQLVDPSNKELISMIEGAEYTMAHQDDFITVGDDALLDEDPTGSNSDSDFDIENKPSANGTKWCDVKK
jgi:hypothetical protein